MESRSRASPEQFTALLEFMESFNLCCNHGDLTRPQQGPQGRIKADRLWQELGELINPIGRAVIKPLDKWKKQGENDADSNFTGDDSVSNEITEHDSQEESEESTDNDKYDSKDVEKASESESSEQEKHEKKKVKTLSGVQSGGSESTENDKKRHKQYMETINRFITELKAGDKSDLIGQNQHIAQTHFYNDLGRRSVAQALKNIEAENVDYLTPEKAPPELVLLVAKESALLRAGKDTDLGSDFDRKKILRSGDYWNGVWKEEVIPKSAMRSALLKKKLGWIKARINPGTEFYKVVSRMKKMSPQLLYIINKKQP